MSSAKQSHLSFLAAHSLSSLGKIGREETFTGVLVAALLNRRIRPVVLQGAQVAERLELQTTSNSGRTN